jgi:DNA-binding transcriptional ArsR family regulator
MSSDPQLHDRSAPYIETQHAVATLAAVLAAAATQAASGQWATLGAVPDSERLVGPIIDPEALLLLTAWVATREPSIGPVMHDWVAQWSDLLSVQRTRNLAKLFPSSIDAELRAVAVTAFERRKDFRWSPMIKGRNGTGAADPDSPESMRRGALPAGAAHLPVKRDALLALRFRMAFGVGARADALAFLLARGSTWSTVTEIAQATAYTPSAIRRALDRMADAHIVLVVDDGTTRYRCEAAPWATLLGLQAPLEPWCYWLQHFVFVTSFVEWAESIARRKLTAYAIMEGLRAHARTYRPNDDRDAIRAWDHAFRDGATMGEMEAALASVGETLRRMA